LVKSLLSLTHQLLILVASSTKFVRDTDGPFGKYISRMYWLQQAWLNEKISPYSIRITQYSILRNLYKHDGRSQEQIASDLKIDKALCSREVRKLEKAGFVIRKRDEKDSRKLLVRLTERAWSLEQELVDIGDQLNDKVLAGFSPEEEEIAYRIAKRVITNLDRTEVKEDGNDKHDGGLIS
jgi:DNA-binding MarR family transcriptional regulator